MIALLSFVFWVLVVLVVLGLVGWLLLSPFIGDEEKQNERERRARKRRAEGIRDLRKKYGYTDDSAHKP